MTNQKIIFFGNGPLAESALKVLESTTDIIFHAKTKEDLTTVKRIKHENPDALGILASFGVLIDTDILELFEPEGILNIHPSLLPKYRGASPIESAILNGDNDFSISIMKLVKAMDAGPLYYQETLSNLPLDKKTIYDSLATKGATWLVENIPNFINLHKSKELSTTLFPNYHLQNDAEATFTSKLDKTMSMLTPSIDSSCRTLRKIIAYQGFPKPKYTFFEQEVIILSAHIEDSCPTGTKKLFIKCADDKYVIIDQLQPPSRKPMDTRSFLNGLKNK
jgi:methionyl-tRNA formyltransferase